MVKADMHPALMGKHPNVQVVACIDIFTTFKTSGNGMTDLKLLAMTSVILSRIGSNMSPEYFSHFAVTLCRPGYVGPVFLVRHQEFGEFPKGCIGPVLLLVILKFPRVVRAMQFIDVLFEPSTIDPSGPCSARLIRGEIC
jgi:hypothetical protein